MDVDDKQFLTKRWRLKQLQDEELFAAVFKSEKKFNFENGFTARDIWKSSSTKIEALKLLGVGKIIESGVFSSQDDWVQEIVNRYSDAQECLDLIGISKAKRTLNDDGTPKNLQYVKKMVERFADYFGLEAALETKTKTDRLYSVTTPESLDDFLPDIDEALDIRRDTLIENCKELSLKGAAQKAEENARIQQEWEQKHQAELNKKLLEAQANAETREMVAGFSSIYINQKKNVPPTEVYNQTDNTEWYKPDSIADVASMLEYCDTPQMLAELRETKIPVPVLKVAARQLPSEKRNQIREWVVGNSG